MKALQRDFNRYCVFHKDIRHWTKGCWHLKWELEQLFYNGHLGDMMEANRDYRQDSKVGSSS